MSDALATSANPSTWLARRYTTALALLASLVLGDFIARATLEPASGLDTHLLDVAGRQVSSQRMLALGMLAPRSDGSASAQHFA